MLSNINDLGTCSQYHKKLVSEEDYQNLGTSMAIIYNICE